MKKTIVSAVASLIFCAPLLARSAEGWVVADISLQAGPDTEYPSLDELAAGTPVTIAGCIEGWTWCDVIAVDGERGWVPGSFLEEEYNNAPVIVLDYGPRIGIPVVSFSLGVYWDHYYRHRPFYSQRHEWTARTIRPHAPPRPAAIVATQPRSGGASRMTTTQQHRTSTPSGSSTATAPAERDARRSQERPAEQRDVQRAERPADRIAKPEFARPEPAKPSDAAPQMKPTEAPRAEPPHPEQQAQAQQPHEHAQRTAKQAGPKTKDELKKVPDKSKKKDEGDSGGGKEL
jgi:uncharacterized protein YraI